MSATTATESSSLELDDIQGGAIHQRPSPYVGTYLLLRIDDRQAGQELIRRLLPAVCSASTSSDPAPNAWVTVAFTYQGFKVLGMPKDSLDSFAPEFRQGMAARAAELGDRGESSPEHWEKPLGTPDVHVALAGLSPDAARLEASLEHARRAVEDLSGVEVIWRQDCYQLPTGRTSFGFKDGIGQPAIEGSGIPASNPLERPIKAGEFILGYPDETGELAPMPTPTVLGRNGTYVVFRKLHTRVAAYRRYLRDRAADRQEEALLGAKMVGRWQSGAPLALAPDHDDPELGSDDSRNNAFLYGDDRRGLKCPAGAHARRANPRDAFDGDGSVDVRLHRMIRRGTSYGSIVPDGVLEDDGKTAASSSCSPASHLKRQFEFVKTQWLNDGIFIGAPQEQDPLVGRPAGTGTSRSPSNPSGAGYRIWRRSSSRAAASTASRPAFARCAGSRNSHLGRSTQTGGAMAASSTNTERWKVLDFGPPPPEGEEPDNPVLLEYAAGESIAMITLNRPHADNAITTEMGASLTDVLETIAVRPAVRVVIITGAGSRAFSVGSDLRQRNNMTKEGWLRQRQDFDRTLYTLRELRKPIFAAVNGVAYGGGSEIAQSTDFIIASENATFGQPEAMVGLSAGGGSPVFLPRVLPPGRALQMLMTGDPISVQEAHRLGMVNELYPQAELMEAAHRIAEKIASNSPTAVQAVKRAVRLGHGQPTEEAIAIMMEAHWRSAVHPDRVEGIGAFNENRDPSFQDTDY